MNALVYPDTPLEKITERKNAIEEVEAQIKELEQEAKKITEAKMQFWGSVVQDEQLEKLTEQLQEAEGQLATLKTALKAMPPVVQITRSAKLRELQ